MWKERSRQEDGRETDMRSQVRKDAEFFKKVFFTIPSQVASVKIGCPDLG